MLKTSIAIATASLVFVGSALAQTPSRPAGERILATEPGPGALKTGECVLVKPQRGSCPKAYEVCGTLPGVERTRSCRRDIK
jgi:hypothetical protein